VTRTDASEIQPSEFLTVKVYCPAGIPVITVDDPVLVVVTPPGFLVTVHVPEGKPVSCTEPVAVSHVG
jgi:hypothetical protein